MSGKSAETYASSYSKSEELFSPDDSVRLKAASSRRGRIEEARKEAPKKKVREVRDEKNLYDKSKVRLGITSPDPKTERVHVVLIDNSGSNARIAEHLRKSSGYLSASLKAIDPTSQVAFVYFSDHGDGDRLMQEVDFISPNEEGDIILYSTLKHVFPANGYDEPEAIECALWRVCEIDFCNAKERHLYLITDVVAHGMGLRDDHGCPEQRDWHKSVERVNETFTTFTVVGCGDDPRCGELQKKFLAPERIAYDLIDLSSIPETEHRQGITGNAFLFLAARSQGPQAVEMFLATLYEKWLKDPVFGANTDMRAKEWIRRFGKYLEIPDSKVEKMMEKVLV